MNLFSTLKIITFLLIGGVLICVSCQKFDNKQEIPAYIKIDKFNLSTQEVLEGANSTSISDAWVYVDEKLLGVYELPAKIPVLENGLHRLRICPGVKFNGNSDLRGIYPLYTQYDNREADLKIDGILECTPNIEYEKNIDIEFNESFENGNNGTLMKSDTAAFKIEGVEKGSEYADPEIVITSISGADPLDARSDYVMKMHLDEEKKAFVIRPNNDFSFHTEEGYRQDLPVFLEVETKSDLPIAIWLVGDHDDGTVYPEEFAYIKARDKWTKLYFNITPFIDRNINTMKKFKIYFMANNLNENGEHVTSDIFIDNIKLIHR